MPEEVFNYNIWTHSNSLIKNVTPFEDDAEIRLLNVLSNVVYLQTTRRYFYPDGVTKIDFYFEVFKQLLQNHVLSYLTGAT